MTKFDEQLIGLYRKVFWIKRFHVIVRQWLCPFNEVERYVPLSGKILDLGCGYGIFSNFLAMKSARRYVVGVDKDAGRIAVAHSTVSTRKNLEFKTADLDNYVLDNNVKCAVLLDLPLEVNKGLLTRIYTALPPEGTLIIKSISRSPGWKYYFTLLHMATVDKLLRLSFKKNSHFLKEEEFMSLLKEVGFQAKFLNIDRGYPYSHCLYICSKS
jgi:2-polyprenyl-3-methyl-5-hydroxy-6-metoxy-1,4-benzoquinol methylase